VWLCPDHSLSSVGGYGFTATVNINQVMNPSVDPPNWIKAISSDGKFKEIVNITSPTGQVSFPMTGTIQTNSSLVGITFSFSQTFTGTLIIDDVKITPI